ncbi:MAG: hypothetical protein L6Q54_15890, partial [Leptospiraceae bacterium]|nr:hypothetical protein [Leptospiraceae bacterium]
MKTLIIFLINFIAACNGIATNNMEVTGSKKSKYKQTFNNMVMIYLQLPQTSNSIESNNEPPLTENENSTLTPNVQNQVFYLSEYELKENLKIENDMKDKGLLKENILKTIGENYVQMVTYPQPTQDDIDSMIDEKSLGIEHKKREYSITELQSKKQESLN